MFIGLLCVCYLNTILKVLYTFFCPRPLACCYHIFFVTNDRLHTMFTKSFKKSNLPLVPPPVPHTHQPPHLPTLFPMPSETQYTLFGVSRDHRVAFPPCQLPSSPSAKWNVKPHLWLALSAVMQGKQKAKWLFIVRGIPTPPNPPLSFCVCCQESLHATTHA